MGECKQDVHAISEAETTLQPIDNKKTPANAVYVGHDRLHLWITGRSGRMCGCSISKKDTAREIWKCEMSLCINKSKCERKINRRLITYQITRVLKEGPIDSRDKVQTFRKKSSTQICFCLHPYIKFCKHICKSLIADFICQLYCF